MPNNFTANVPEKCAFKLDILKQELDVLVGRIDHFDDLRHRTKQLSVTLWLAAVGTALARPASRPLLWLAPFIPLPFWYFDAQYHAYQERFALRWRAIREFIREEHFDLPSGKAALDEFFVPSSKSAFPIPDYYADKTFDFEKDDKLRYRISLRRNAFTKKMLWFYGTFIAAAFILIALLQVFHTSLV